jgi:hypothetical protein
MVAAVNHPSTLERILSSPKALNPTKPFRRRYIGERERERER